MGYVVAAQGGSWGSWSCVLFLGHLELAPQYPSTGFELSTLELMGQWEEVVLARKLPRGAFCGQVFSEMSSPRARLEGTPTAAAQSFSPVSSPEPPSPQSRELLVVLGSTRTGQPGVVHPDRARSLSCPELFPLCGHSGLQTYILHHVSHGAPSALPFAFELRGLPTDHVPASGRKTDVERGRFSHATSVKADSCIKGEGEEGRRSSASLGNIRGRLC